MAKIGNTLHVKYLLIFANLCRPQNKTLQQILKLSINYQAQCLTQEPGALDLIPSLANCFGSPSTDSRRAAVHSECSNRKPLDFEDSRPCSYRQSLDH